MASSNTFTPVISPNTQHCVLCAEPAPQECSKCHAIRYCGREHQESDWSVHRLVCDMIANYREERPSDKKTAYVFWFPTDMANSQLILMHLNNDFCEGALAAMLGSRNIARIHLGNVRLGPRISMPPSEHEVFVLYAVKDPAARPNRVSEAFGLDRYQPATLWSKGGLIVAAATGDALTDEEKQSYQAAATSPPPLSGGYCDVFAADLSLVKDFMCRALVGENLAGGAMVGNKPILRAQQAVDHVCDKATAASGWGDGSLASGAAWSVYSRQLKEQEE